jgi:hypothetical protein
MVAISAIEVQSVSTRGALAAFCRKMSQLCRNSLFLCRKLSQRATSATSERIAQPVAEKRALRTKGYNIRSLRIGNELPVTLRFFRQDQLAISGVEHLRTCVA